MKEVLAAGASLNLKEITIRMKLRRGLKEGKVVLGKEGYSFK